MGVREIGKRPTVYFEISKLPELVDKALQVLVQSDSGIYARGTGLFRVVRVNDNLSDETCHIPASLVLVAVEKVWLAEILSKHIHWQKWSSTKDEYVDVGCPRIVAETIIARRGDWPFYQLKAIINTPTLRSDGTIIESTGFDRQSGFLFDSNISFPDVPKMPSKYDAEVALNQLASPLREFPFESDIDRSTALAMLLTAVVRPSLPTAPMFGATAPTPGTRKSKLIDLASILSQGKVASVMSTGRDETELEKRIGAALLVGDTFVSLDNIEHPLQSKLLCQVLTQETCKVRKLGESSMFDIPTLVTFCATGNNLRFQGDLTRRVCMIHLDALVERPEERRFEFDPILEFCNNRSKLVVATLTILRAFIISGEKPAVPTMGSFEKWSDLIRSSLIWLNQPDPLSNSRKIRNEDPDYENFAVIISTLPAGNWTVASLAQALEIDNNNLAENRRYPELREALIDFFDNQGKLHTAKFGKYLSKNRGRIVDGKRIVKLKKDSLANVNRWAVETT